MHLIYIVLYIQLLHATWLMTILKPTACFGLSQVCSLLQGSPILCPPIIKSSLTCQCKPSIFFMKLHGFTKRSFIWVHLVEMLSSICTFFFSKQVSLQKQLARRYILDTNRPVQVYKELPFLQRPCQDQIQHPSSKKTAEKRVIHAPLSADLQYMMFTGKVTNECNAS